MPLSTGNGGHQTDSDQHRALDCRGERTNLRVRIRIPVTCSPYRKKDEIILYNYYCPLGMVRVTGERRRKGAIKYAYQLIRHRAIFMNGKKTGKTLLLPD